MPDIDLASFCPGFFCGLVLSLTGQVSNDGREVSPSDIIKDMDLDTLYYLQQQATDQLKILEMHYKNFQNRMKMINSHPHTTPREENIKKIITTSYRSVFGSEFTTIQYAF